MKAILLDANLLVLWIIGEVESRWIGRHKRAKTIVASDWHLLQDIIGDARILTTPHILAEAGNLLRAGGMWPDAHVRLMAGLALFIARAQEEHVPAQAVTGSKLYRRLGLTDAALLSSASPDAHLLTAYLDLCHAALSQGPVATNFNHCRDAAG